MAAGARDGGLGGAGAPEGGAWGARTSRASVLWLTAASYSRLANDLLASSHDFSALLSAMTQGQNIWKEKEGRGKTNRMKFLPEFVRPQEAGQML